MINVWIDDLTPCLKDNETGDFVATEVVRIRRKSFLSKFNKKNGWYTNWEKLLPEHEVYALAYGFDGVIVGYAANMDLVKHYCEVFRAEHIAMLHPNQIAIYENEAADIRKVYDYEWTDEEI